MSKKPDKQYKAPTGTVYLMIIFVLLIIAMWGSAFITLAQRGGTG